MEENINNAQWAIDQLKERGYSDGEIAEYAGVARQSIVEIRHGRSGGGKIVDKLWALKRRSDNDEIPLPDPQRSTADKEVSSSSDDDRYLDITPDHIALLVSIVIAVMFIILLVVVSRRHMSSDNTPQQSDVTMQGENEAS